MNARASLCSLSLLSLSLSFPALAQDPQPPSPPPAPSPSPAPEEPAAAPAPSPAAFAGRWSGSIEIPGSTLPIVVRIQQTAGGFTGTIDIQGAVNVLLQAMRVESPKVHFELTTPNGLAAFDGELAGDTIAGKFSQSGFETTFSMQRERDDIVPYKVEEVTFPSGRVTLAGTLTLPQGTGPFPAFVLISGSGPQNRDEELFGFRPFQKIADHMTRLGVAVLRYDDRGVGGSGGTLEGLTTKDLADDVEAALTFLRTRTEIKPRTIGLIGHSEGALIAPIVSSRDSGVALIVLLAGPAIPGDEILYLQKEMILRASGADDSKVELGGRVQESIFEFLRTGSGRDETRSLIVEELKASQSAAEPMPDAQMQAIADKTLEKLQDPWMKHFIDYDPLPALERADCPILALFGGLDLQVPAAVNERAMREAFANAGHRDALALTFPSANHLFQQARTGTPQEYATLEKDFFPGFLKVISDWALIRFNRTSP